MEVIRAGWKAATSTDVPDMTAVAPVIEEFGVRRCVQTHWTLPNR